MMALLACVATVPVPAAPDDSSSDDSAAETGETGIFEYGGASSEIFDEGLIHRFVIHTDEAEWNDIVRNPEDEEYIRATVELGEVRVEDVGLRFKGSWGSLFWCADGTLDCDKLNLKLDFHEYVEEQLFYDLKKLNLHATEVDDSNMRESLAYAVWRNAGVPASRTGWATVEVNGEELGLFLLVEQVDGRFTRDRWGSSSGEGDLYKEVWITQTSTSAWSAALASNRDGTATPERMISMVEALSDSEDEDFVEVLSAYMDPRSITRFLAAEELSGSFDSIAAFYCGWSECGNHNYFWYDKGDEVVLIPWDMDRSFDVPVPLFDTDDVPRWYEDEGCDRIEVLFGIDVMPPGCDPFLGAVRDTLSDAYLEDRAAVKADAASLDVLNAEVDRLELLLGEAVANDPHGPTVSEWEAAVEDLRADLVELDGRY